MITRERLQELVRYDPETGLFAWNAKIRGVKAGTRPGTKRSDGYLQIRLDQRNYKAHRLAWLYVHGGWPAEQIDHINGDRFDNRISNLRSVSHAENAKNQRPRATNTSGEIGVSWFARDAKWWVKITVNRRVKHVGYFASIEEAVTARDSAYKAAGFHQNHGRR